MNIKNPETEGLAREVAALTGETLTSAITVALRERRDRLTAGDRLARIRAISGDAARRWSPELRDVDHGDLLYGPDGLPWS